MSFQNESISLLTKDTENDNDWEKRKVFLIFVTFHKFFKDFLAVQEDQISD